MPNRMPIRLRQFFEMESVPLTLSARDEPDMPLIVANEAFCRLTGYTREEVLGRNCRFLQGPFDNTLERSRIRKCLDSGSDDYFILANEKKSGQRFLNFLYLAPIEIPAYSERFVLGTQFDVTNEFQDSVEQHFQKVGAVLETAIHHGYSDQVVIESKKLAAQSVRNVLQYILETEAGREARDQVTV